MILNTVNRQRLVTHTFNSIVIQVYVRHFQTGYKVDEGLRVDGWQWNGGDS